MHSALAYFRKTGAELLNHGIYVCNSMLSKVFPMDFNPKADESHILYLQLLAVLCIQILRVSYIV